MENAVLTMLNKPQKLPLDDIKVSFNYEVDDTSNSEGQFSVFATALDDDSDVFVEPKEFCCKNFRLAEFKEASAFEPLLVQLSKIHRKVRRLLLTVSINPDSNKTLCDLKNPTLVLKSSTDDVLVQYEIPNTSSCNDLGMSIGHFIKSGRTWSFIEEYETFNDGIVEYSLKFKTPVKNEEWFF